MFKAHVLTETDGKVTGALTELEESRLPEGDVTVDVEYSTLNYKDGMVLKGIGRLVRSYPHVPGVDFAGTVSASSDPRWKAGDKVVLTGWRVGEWHWGGYAQKARVKGDWLVALPKGLTTKQAMAVGTAGFTAQLAVMAVTVAVGMAVYAGLMVLFSRPELREMAGDFRHRRPRQARQRNSDAHRGQQLFRCHDRVCRNAAPRRRDHPADDQQHVFHCLRCHTENPI